MRVHYSSRQSAELQRSETGTRGRYRCRRHRENGHSNSRSTPTWRYSAGGCSRDHDRYCWGRRFGIPGELSTRPPVCVHYCSASEIIADFLYSAIALTTVGFGIVLVLAVLCCNDIGHKMNNKIEVFLENDVQAAKNEFHEELHVKDGLRRRSSVQAA